MFLSDVLGGLLRPARCLACGTPAAWPCCARCLPPTPGDVGPWPLAADPEVPLWALGAYRDALRAAVLAGKLDDQPAALTELGRRLGGALAVAGAGADLVTYVAAGRVAGLPRDHAERIATGVATALDLPMVGLLAPSGGRDLGRRARRAGRPRPRPPVPPTANGPVPPGRRPGPAGRRPGHHRRHPRPRRRHPPPRRRPPRRSRRPRHHPGRPAGRPRPSGRPRFPRPAASFPPDRCRGGPLGRGVVRWSYDRDLPCSRRSHCVVVTCFRV